MPETDQRTDQPTDQRTDQRPLPDRVTMPLLDLVTREAMDQDYVQAARRRAEQRAARLAAGADPGEPDEHRRHGLRGVAVATSVFGLLIALAAVQNSRDADVEEAGRQALVARIDQRQSEVDGAEERISRTRDDIDDLRTLATRLQGQLTQATTDLRALQVSTGFVAVRGPGLRITVDDDPDGSADGQVRATDLRLLVNGLWEAGAEAIAVNGRRLSVLSAITNSSIAINVNQQPLSPPYVVSAVGDDRTLQGDLLRTASGAQFESLAEQYGYDVDREGQSELLLPAAPTSQLRLRFATEDDGVPDKQADREDTP